MIIDTSALFAILAGEPEGPAFARAIATAPRPMISAATLVEAQVVVQARLGSRGRRRLDALLRASGAEVVPFDAQQATIASDAYRDYGKGSGHAARLDLGDCYSYALASQADEPLLYQGDDFVHTDIRAAAG